MRLFITFYFSVMHADIHIGFFLLLDEGNLLFLLEICWQILQWFKSLYLDVTGVCMHLASRRSIKARSGLYIQKITWDGWFLDQTPTWIASLLLSASPSNIPLPVALVTLIYPRLKVVTTMTLIIQSTSCFSTSPLLTCSKVLPSLFHPLFSLCALGFLISCLKNYILVMAVYFSTAHYVLDQSHQLNSHRQSNNYLMAITFHHWWPGLHSNWLFCDASGLITDILKYAALSKLLCAWLWR